MLSRRRIQARIYETGCRGNPMRESWFKFTAIGHADRYGFGTVAEAVKFANGLKLDRSASDFTSHLLSAKEVALRDPGRRTDALMLRDALRSRLDRCQTPGTG
jgi:hypothetical protein